LIYIPLVVAAWLVYARLSRRRDRHNLARLEAAASAGLTEPFSLHPFIDPYKCLGSGACVLACPEGDVLGMIGGKSNRSRRNTAWRRGGVVRMDFKPAPPCDRHFPHVLHDIFLTPL